MYIKEGNSFSELKKQTKAGEEVLNGTKEVKRNILSTKDPMHTLSLEIEQKHEKTGDAVIEEQRKCLEMHAQELHKHDTKFASAETQLSVMTTKQTNVSQRVSHAVHEITELSKSQRKTNEELKQAQKSIAYICEAKRQLSDEVGKTKDIVQQLSLKGEETMKLVENYVTTMQKQLQEAKSKHFMYISSQTLTF